MNIVSKWIYNRKLKSNIQILPKCIISINGKFKLDVSQKDNYIMVNVIDECKLLVYINNMIYKKGTSIYTFDTNGVIYSIIKK